MNHFARGAIVMSMAALLGACSSTPPQPSAPSTSSGSAAAGTTAAPRPPTAATPRPAATSAVATVTLAAHLDPNHAVSKNRSIFFDFDDVAGHGINQDLHDLFVRGHDVERVDELAFFRL